MGLHASLGGARQSTDIEEFLLLQERGRKAIGYNIAHFFASVPFVGWGGQRVSPSHLFYLHVGWGLLLLSRNGRHPFEHPRRFLSGTFQILVTASAAARIPAIATVR